MCSVWGKSVHANLMPFLSVRKHIRPILSIYSFHSEEAEGTFHIIASKPRLTTSVFTDAQWFACIQCFSCKPLLQTGHVLLKMLILCHGFKWQEFSRGNLEAAKRRLLNNPLIYFWYFRPKLWGLQMIIIWLYTQVFLPTWKDAKWANWSEIFFYYSSCDTIVFSQTVNNLTLVLR